MEKWLQDCINIIGGAGGLSSDTEVENSLFRIAEWVRSANLLSPSALKAYSSILRYLTDHVAEWIYSFGATSKESAIPTSSAVHRNRIENAFDSIFLDGPPHLSFECLVQTLQGPAREFRKTYQDTDESFWAVDACLRVLCLFVSPKLNGVNRLARIVEADMTHTALSSALVHLPSIVANVSINAKDGVESIIRSDEYYSILADALFEAQETRATKSSWRRDDSGDDTPKTRTISLISEVTGRLCTLGWSNIMVSCWCRHPRSNGPLLATLVLQTPVSGIALLVRSLVEEPARVDRCQGTEELISHALEIILKTSKTALDAMRFQIPFRYPLVPRVQRHESLPRLVRTMMTSGFGWDGLRSAAIFWSGSSVSSSPDLALQNQVTRVVLLYMAAIFDRSQCEAEDSALLPFKGKASDPALVNSLAIRLAEGVSSRLSSSQYLVRRLGMVVGEALSRIQGDPTLEIRFPRNSTVYEAGSDAYDSDLSDLAELQWPVFDRVDESINHSQGGGAISEIQASSPSGYGPVSEAQKGVCKMSVAPSATTRQSWWCDDDDWRSLDSFVCTSDEELGEQDGVCNQSKLTVNAVDGTFGRGKSPIASINDYELVKKQVSAPFSVARTVGLLRALNNGDEKLAMEPELIAATLRTICDNAHIVIPGIWPNSQETVEKDIPRHRACSSVRKYGSKYSETCTFHLSLRDSATAMTKAVLGVDSGRFPERIGKEVAEARQRALIALTQLDIKSVGCMLVSDVFYGQTADVTRRSEALSILADSIRALTDPSQSTEILFESGSGESVIDERKVSSDTYSGRVTRRFDKSLMMSSRREASRGSAIKVNGFSAVAGSLFFVIANSLFDNVGADFLDLSSRHSGLTAQALATAGLILSRSGIQCKHRRDMCIALLELSTIWRGNDSAVVRRAVALALGSVARAIDVQWLRDGYGSDVIMGDASPFVGGQGILLQWLKDTADGGDADLYVRQFASTALRDWLDKLTAIAESNN